MPYGPRSFQIDFDFIDHQLMIRTSDGDVRSLELRPRSVADFYRELMATLRDLGLAVAIFAEPNELEDATPFLRRYTLDTLTRIKAFAKLRARTQYGEVAHRWLNPASDPSQIAIRPDASPARDADAPDAPATR